MKKYLKAPFVLIALAFSLTAHAATPSLEELRTGIKADIVAKRLSTPAGNNALAKIQQHRQRAPFNFQITPLIYEWGEAYVALAKEAMAQKQYAKAQGYLDNVWPVAALTPGLEELQTQLDQLGVVSAQPARPAGPSAEELERQRQVAASAAAERARLEADRKKQQEEQRRQQELAKKQAAEELAKRQEQERARRQAAAEAQQAAASAPAAAATTTTPAVPVVAVAAPAAIISTQEVQQLWEEAEEESAPIASYPLDAQLLSSRDRDGIQKALAPICKAILDNEASVVVHSKSQADYRWLTVRLTICLRNLDSSFRLRYSHQDNEVQDGEPYIALHPARDVSLIRQVSE